MISAKNVVTFRQPEHVDDALNIFGTIAKSIGLFKSLIKIIDSLSTEMAGQ